MSSNLLALHGKRSLITGASKGIGRGLASAFVAYGADIVAVARDEAGLAKVKMGTKSLRRSFQVIRADLVDMTEVARVAVEAGEVHILVNNAGVSYPESALETSLDH